MTKIEGSRNELQKVNPTAAYYLDILLEEDFMRDNQADRWASIVLAPPEVALRKIQGLASELQKYTVDRKHARDRRVIKAWEIMEGFVTSHKADLTRMGATLYVGGSMIFDDPIGLDLDLDVLLDSGSKWQIHNYIFQESGLSELWSTISAKGVDLKVTLIDELRGHAGRISGSDRAYIYEHAEDMALDFGCASIVFTGKPVFAPASGLPERVKGQIIQLARQSPIMAADMYISLIDCRDIRLERRTRSLRNL